MDNVAISRKGNELTIKIDLSKKGTPSVTGKSLLIASTKGNQPIEGTEGFVLGLNVYKKR